VVRIMPVQIRHKGTCIADRCHERRNFRRRLVAARRLPARTPAKSVVAAWNDAPSRLPGPLSTHSRTSAATERPVERAFCLSCRSVGSGSLIVMPLMAAIPKRNLLLSDQQHHPILRFARPARARLHQRRMSIPRLQFGRRPPFSISLTLNTVNARIAGASTRRLAPDGSRPTLVRRNREFRVDLPVNQIGPGSRRKVG